jgi:hypothetical protein
MHVHINFCMYVYSSFSSLLNIPLTNQVTNLIILIISQLQLDVLLSLPAVSDLNSGKGTRDLLHGIQGACLFYVHLQQ